MLVLALVAATLSVSALLVPPQPAEALPCMEWNCDYYSDATYTVLVGRHMVLCAVGVRDWGEVTPYEICYSGDFCPYCEPCGWPCI
jgi:hypothetical protein